MMQDGGGAGRSHPAAASNAGGSGAFMTGVPDPMGEDGTGLDGGPSSALALQDHPGVDHPLPPHHHGVDPGDGGADPNDPGGFGSVPPELAPTGADPEDALQEDQRGGHQFHLEVEEQAP